MALKLKVETSTEELVPEIVQLLQAQVNHEFENERLYLSMAFWCDANGYPETAKFFSGHSGEEKNHAMDFVNHMLRNEYPLETPYTVGIPKTFDSLEDILKQSIAREKETTKMILKLYRTAEEESVLAINVAKKYLVEQEEEEQLFRSLYNLWKLCNGNKIDFEMEVGALKSSGKYILGKI
jgi:ferritin